MKVAIRSSETSVLKGATTLTSQKTPFFISYILNFEIGWRLAIRFALHQPPEKKVLVPTGGGAIAEAV
jgi:hypothetical protein